MVNVLHPRQKGPYQQLSILKACMFRVVNGVIGYINTFFSPYVY